VRGKPLDKVRLFGPSVAKLKQQNLAVDIQKDPEARASIRRLESLEVKDGKIILRGK